MSNDKIWENIYSKEKQINRYPYGELVSIFFHSLKFLDTETKEKSKIKVLELGCGAGNNLWFFAENGFDTYGIDGSESACKIAKELCESRNQKVTIQQAYFDNLPFENESMDIIIDRELTCCGTEKDIKKWWKEANRVLKKEGIVISFKFSEYSQIFVKIKKNKLISTKVEDFTFKDIKDGKLADTGTIHFSTKKELFEIFDFCDIKYINRHSSDTIYDMVSNQYNYDEYIVVGVKK